MPTKTTAPMKMKFLLAGTCSLLLNVSSFAQGTVIVQNSSTQLVTMWYGPSAPVGTHVAFYYSATAVTDPLSASLNLIPGGVGILAPAPGRFFLGTKTTYTDAAPGSTIYASVRGWTGAYTDWNSAYAAALAGDPGAILGVSPVFRMATGGAGIPPSPPVSLHNVPGFTGLVLGVPEPSAQALGILGVILLVWWRRSAALVSRDRVSSSARRVFPLMVPSFSTTFSSRSRSKTRVRPSPAN